MLSIPSIIFFFIFSSLLIPSFTQASHAPSGPPSKKTSSDPSMVMQQNSSPACSFLSHLSQKKSVTFSPNVSCSLPPPPPIITFLIYFHFMPLVLQPHTLFTGFTNQVGDNTTEICPHLLSLPLTVRSTSLTLSLSCLIQIKQIPFGRVEMERDTGIMPCKSPHPFPIKFIRGCHLLLLWRQSPTKLCKSNLYSAFLWHDDPFMICNTADLIAVWHS